MKKSILIFVTLVFSLTCFAQNTTPKISLITFAPGNEAYSVFGHTAIRVQDYTNKTDLVYNFGMFDFNAPNFLLKFIKGKLDYRVGIEQFTPMLRPYFKKNRQITEQILNLNPQQTNQLIDRLSFLYRPENRYYRYGFLKRNCSTELRELFFQEVKDVLYKPTKTSRTYRNYLNDYMKPMPWLKFGVNLALGSTIDHEITSYDKMFLPDFLSEEVEKATINKRPLASPPQKMFDHLNIVKSSSWKLTPFILFSFLFVVMVLGRSRVLIQTFTFSVGIGGLIILIINLISAHAEVHYNYNLLWCNPLYLLSFGLCFTQYKTFHKTLATILTLCLLTTLGIWFSKTQGYDYTFFPILISLLWINLKQTQRK